MKLLNDREGRRLDAAAICMDALHHYADAGGAPLPLAGFIYSQLGVLNYEANELVDARAHHEQALALGERLGLDYQMIYACALAAPTWYALGEPIEPCPHSGMATGTPVRRATLMQTGS